LSPVAGTVVWITGASSGIGAAVARELHRRGALLALTARRPGPLADLAAELGGAIALAGDVTDRARMLEIHDEIRAEFGRVDLVLLNAGMYEPVSPDTFSADVVRRHLDVNVMGVVHGIAAVLPDMRARRAGRIAVVASLTGYVALPRAAAYGASKAFLISMCDSLRADLVRDGVGMTVIAPGFVRTPLTRQNDFEMPFVIDAAAAGRIIADALEAGRDHVAFPLRLAALMRLLAYLPGPLRRRRVARTARRLSQRGSKGPGPFDPR
jgi:NADP-dependent 3-hydroxy acid dehydrogenase YdfG